MLSKQQEKARVGIRDTVLNVLLPTSPVVCSPWAMAGGQHGHSLQEVGHSWLPWDSDQGSLGALLP